jgi:predicted ester cyclase
MADDPGHGGRTAEEAVRRLVDAVWNGTDEAAVTELVDPSCPGQDGSGPDAVLAWHRDRRSSFPDLLYSVTDLVTDGDRAAWRWTATGTHEGRFGPVAPSGRRVEYAGATFARLGADGRFVDVWSVNELFQLLTQLGVQVTPPE